MPAVLVGTVLALVAPRAVLPDWSTRLEVNAAHHFHLAGAHARVPLQQNHRSHLGAQEWQGGLHRLPGHGSDRIRFGSCRPPRSQAFDGSNLVVHSRRHQLLRGPPAQHALDARDVLVDPSPTEPVLDHGIAEGLQGQTVEVNHRGVAVQLPDPPQGKADVGHLGGRTTARMAVVLLDVAESRPGSAH